LNSDLEVCESFEAGKKTQKVDEVDYRRVASELEREVKDWQVKCQHLETQLRQKTLELSKAKKAAPVAPQPSKFKEPQLQDGEKYTSFRWRVIMN
jgi:hypothetical protein